MPAKHSARPVGPARIVLSAAAAVLVMLVVWVAARAVGPASASRQPWLVQPSASFAAPSPGTSTSPSPLVLITSPSPSRSPSAVRRSPSRSPSPSRTRTPSPARTTVPNSLAVTVNVGAGWDQGYVAAGRVRNTGDTARTWTVTVTHSGLRNLTLRNTWNATGRQSGNTFTFAGGPLAPGATADFGYQATKSGRGDARPSGCSVVGGRCSVS